ncbi:MAG: hypothetical protein DMF75_15190 [Acidobacteria bacterium]|nr:MAG: hypothetical protein DMF75_15190 [Acidobacteriota bacterium]
MSDLRRLLGYLLPHTGTFVAATFAMIVVAVLETATSALIVPIFDQAFAHGNARPTSTPFALQRLIPASGLHAWRMIALLLIVFTVVKGIAEYFSTYWMAYIGQSSVLTLRRELYSHILGQSAAFFERHRTNYLVSRLISSAAAIEAALTHTLRDMLREGFTLIAFMAASFYVSWRLTLGSLLIEYLTDTAQEALANQSIVKAYRGEAREQNRFTAVALRVRRANLRSASIAGMSPPIIELIGVVFIAALLFFGEREIRLGRMDMAQFLLFIFLLFRSYDPMRKLSRLQNSMSQAQSIWPRFDNRSSFAKYILVMQMKRARYCAGSA